MTKSVSYKDAGVNIDLGNALVQDDILPAIKGTARRGFPVHEQPPTIWRYRVGFEYGRFGIHLEGKFPLVWPISLLYKNRTVYGSEVCYD